MMTILVTGAKGTIESHEVKVLPEKGYFSNSDIYWLRIENDIRKGIFDRFRTLSIWIPSMKYLFYND